MKWLRRFFAPAVRPCPAKPRRLRPILETLDDRFAPAVLTVTSLADSFDPGTLRAAVVQANSDGAFGVPDTVQFAPYLSGTLTLVAPLELAAGAGVTINGSPTIALSGGGATQVFFVDAGASVALNGLTIIYGAGYDGGAIFNAGSLALTGDTLSGNAAYDAGGGIYNQGALALYACTLSGNAAYDAGIVNGGGGIYNTGILTLDASTLSGNAATFDGGGLYNGATGYAFVQDNCNLSGNAATVSGGAIENVGQLSISGGTLWDNTAQLGGAIFNAAGGSMSVEGANLSYNAASYAGGAVSNVGVGLIDGSVLAGNSAFSLGGAVFNSGQLTLSSSSLTYNTAEGGGAVSNLGVSGGMTMSGDAVSGNTAVRGGGIFNEAALAMTGDNVSYNALRLATASDPNPSNQPLGSGLYNLAGGQLGVGTVSLDGSTFIGNNFNADNSLGGDIYGV
jgi:hypothetical protein